MTDLNTFDDLVTWATWQVIQGLTNGERMRSVLYGVLMTAAEWHAEQRKKQGSQP